MTRFRLVPAVIVLVGGMLCVGPAFAQGPDDDAPYSPKVFSRAELIDFGTFDDNPLEVPFDVLETSQEPTYDRVDIHVRLDATFDEVVSHFEDAFGSDDPVARFRDGYVPQAGDEPLEVKGVTKVPEGRRFVLSHPKMRREFNIEIREKGGKALMIFENAAFTQNFLGLVPLRAPFQPVDAESISLD